MATNSSTALCKTTTSTTGTSNYVLSTANNVGPYRTPKQAVADSSLTDGDTVRYICWDTTTVGDALFELGRGIYTDATNVVARVAANVLDGSSGPGSLVSWGAGTRDFYILESSARIHGVQTFQDGAVINGGAGGVSLQVNDAGGGRVQIGDFISDPGQQLDVSGGISIKDGITAPSNVSGHAMFYIDAADGDLKIKFGDGTTKTIATDT